jgi:hypothetical protein
LGERQRAKEVERFEKANTANQAEEMKNSLSQALPVLLGLVWQEKLFV